MMNNGYWIIRIDVADQKKFNEYVAANVEALKKYGAKFLVRAGHSITVEGATRARNTVVEFPSYQMAVDCWNSPEYQAALTGIAVAATPDDERKFELEGVG
jgi:uncharacterized protein (DUF1330 family)